MTLSIPNARKDARFALASEALRRGGPGALYCAIESALSELVGFRLLTILRLEGLQLERVFSSAPGGYPAGGTKSIRDDVWLRTMLTSGEPVITSGEPALSERFVDHDAIRSLGCGSVLNVPVVVGEHTLGSINLLHRSGWFQLEHIDLTVPFAELLARAWETPQPSRGVDLGTSS